MKGVVEPVELVDIVFGVAVLVKFPKVIGQPDALVYTVLLCVCATSSASVIVCVFSPPVSPTALNSVCAASRPTGTLPFRFGTLKVVVPSPTPYGERRSV